MKHIRRGERDFKISKAPGLGMITMLSGSLRQRFALDRKLSCCWQDRAAAVSDPGVAVGGCARRWPDCYSCVAASNRDCGPAISGSYPDRPDGIPDRRRSSGGDYRRSAAGIPDHRKRIDRTETSRAGRSAHNSDNTVRPCRRCITELHRGKNLETFVELVPHPRMALSFTRS